MPAAAVNATPPVLVRVSPTGSVRLEVESVTLPVLAHVIVPESVRFPLTTMLLLFSVHVPVNPVKFRLLNVKLLFEPPNVNPADVPVAASVRSCIETPPLVPPLNVTIPPAADAMDTS